MATELAQERERAERAERDRDDWRAKAELASDDAFFRCSSRERVMREVATQLRQFMRKADPDMKLPPPNILWLEGLAARLEDTEKENG